jgi:hypothetical protein
MKLRIKGNSIRLRVTQSELTKLIATGRIEETIYFTSSAESGLTYALEHAVDAPRTYLRYQPLEVAIILPQNLAQSWAESNQTGIYDSVDLGPQGTLELIVEKDFACLDLSDADNEDTFPNPNADAAC